MESRDVFSQRELEQVLRQADLIPICAGEGEFTVGGGHFVRAADSARLVVGDTVSVEAGGSVSVVAGGRAHVIARNSAKVETGDSATVIARNHSSVQARGQSRVVAGGNSIVEAAENASVVAIGRTDVSAGDRCRVRALLGARVRLYGDARGWVWGMAMARATDRTHLTAWGSATIFATGAASVEALETAVVTASGSATVRAFGSVMVRARGRVRVEAASGVAVMRHGASGMPGAAVAEAVHPSTPQEWCAFYGVPVDDGIVVLYKAVDENYDSYHGTSYRPGSMPSAADWDGGDQECGGGLHFSPRPTFALAAPMDEMRFVACPVRLADIAFYHRGLYPAKVKARGVCAPVYEVNEEGEAVAASPASVS